LPPSHDEIDSRHYVALHKKAYEAAAGNSDAFRVAVVVGGGPSGLYTAWRLILAGIRVLVVEARAEYTIYYPPYFLHPTLSP